MCDLIAFWFVDISDKLKDFVTSKCYFLIHRF